jgi:2-polyprenyl-6-methoxyphenol hydroxylase-like FAD-dependent oxidoreductase
MSEQTSLGKHAVVIGGSIGGLLAGRVLTDYFDKVTIVERDTIGDSVESRKGAPQGNHVHTIYGGGANVIERWLPGLFQTMVSEGATEIDFSKGLVWYHQGVWKMRTDTGLMSFWQSRPFLEAHIRRRVKETPGLEIIENCDTKSLLSNDDKSKITGVQITRRDSGQTEELAADFVVDASGRSSKTPEWLEQLGYQKPQELEVGIDLAYASRIYERPDDASRDWTVMGLYPTAPHNKRVGYIFPIEGQRWVVSQVGYLGDHPSDDENEFLEFAQTLELPDFYEAIKDAKPLTPVVKYRYPAQLRRRYELLPRMPDGLVVLGDAVCSFNPVYGQGMSSCALQVEVLEKTLSALTSNSQLAGIFKSYFRQVGKLVDNPWLLASNSDFLYPETTGSRPFGTRFLNWYIVRVFALCASNKRVLKTFTEVLHFIKKPTALFHPAIILSVLKRCLGFRDKTKESKTRPGII